jgi:hypothetical protein
MVGLVQPLSLSVEPCEIEQKSPRTNTERYRLPPAIQNEPETVLQSATGYESGVSFRFQQDFFAPRKVDLCASFLFATERAPATPEVHATT